MILPDSFLSSWVKQKRNSAWVITVTIGNPTGVRSDQHTYVVGIGPSQATHHNVIANIFEQIEKLRQPKLRYCGKTKRFILTAFDMIAYLSDRPERSHITSTSLMGAFGRRFQWAAFSDEERLPSCSHCYKRRICSMLGIEIDTVRICDCGDWCYDNPNTEAWKQSCSLSKVFATNKKGADAYPIVNTSTVSAEDRSIPELSHLRPKKQTFEWLVSGIKIAFYMFACGIWYRYMLDSFLRSFGINKEARVKVYESAKETKETLKGLSEEERENELSAITEQSLISRGILPKCWLSGVPLHKFIEASMHLCFTGVTSDSLKLIQAFMAKANKKTLFNTSFTEQVLDKVSLFQLEWLKTKELPDSQWASENYLAIARMKAFLFGFYIFHHKPCSGDIEQEDILCMQQFVNSFSMLISSLMRVDDGVSKEMLDTNIKCFLSALHTCEKLLKQKLPDASGLFDKGNFLSLLNIPDQFMMYGPLRFFWEGKLFERGLSINFIFSFLLLLTTSFFCFTYIRKL